MAHSKLYVLGGLLLLLVLGASATPTPDEVNKPIVVQTQLQNYDQPTLRDYEECQENRDKCLDVCAGDSKCEHECPVCPELFSKPVMVQGVNDTDLRAEPQVPVNTTNIIKLTNEIRNIIKHEIQQRNEVNVQVQQNVSQVGGRFGLGYSDQGSCCYVVLMDRKCDKNAGDDCREKSRQRVCGERCQARVMLAKRVVQCDAEDPLNCRETIEYVPRRRRVHAKTSLPSEPCRYFGNSWPYFSCGQHQGEGTGMIQNQRPKRSVCQECLNLPYGYILQSGLPPQCGGCFQGFGSPYMYNPYGFNPYMPFPSYGGFPPNNNPNNDLSNTGNNIGNDLDDKNVVGSGDYILCEDDDVEKCLKENDKQGAPSHQEQAPGFIDDVDDPEYGVETQRRRRSHNNRVFVRSAYSKRNRKNA